MADAPPIGDLPVDVVVRHPRVAGLGRDRVEQERVDAFARDLARWLVGRPADELGALARVVTLVAQRELRDARWMSKDRPVVAVESAARATEVLWPYLRWDPDQAPPVPEEEPAPPAGDGEGEGEGESEEEAEGADDGDGKGEGDGEGEGAGESPGEGESPGASVGAGDGPETEGTGSTGIDELIRKLGAGAAGLEEVARRLGEDEEGDGALAEAADAATEGAVATDKLARTLEQLAPGVGWSTAPGALERSLLDPLVALSGLLERLPELKRLADQLGRVEEASRRKGRGTGGREEVVGVHIGGDVTNALPSELALLGDEDTEDLFYERYLERRLVSLELTGRGDEGASEGSERGPVIACIDTSSSMAGPPEMAAKALVLAICRKVVPQGRLVHLILFGGYGERTEIRLRRGLGGLEGLLQFLAASFRSGTDFDGPLVRAIELLEEQGLETADVLVVTDGLCRAEPAVVDRVNRAKVGRGLRVWSVVLGSAHTAGVDPFSDRVFRFDPNDPSGSVSVVEGLAARRTRPDHGPV